MKITDRTLFISFAAFLDFIGSTISVTIKDLFPKIKGVLPPLEKFPAERVKELTRLGRVGDFNMIDVKVTFLFRKNVIVGFKNKAVVNTLDVLFNQEDLDIVYHIEENQWLEMSKTELRQLGQNRIYDLVVARDVAADLHQLPDSSPPAKVKAHIRACRVANQETDIFEKSIENKRLGHQTRLPAPNVIIMEAYTRVYKREMLKYFPDEGQTSNP
ncbi:uncharacterized protein LOC117168303 [Belonocnema kinseyi]|uniref:uncharacterized protein LOC117168303 n=1 Tax=Belonocnema kinseyi TaxID=2817044 RepID=UPI00143D8767|nr:uncharacterized protein LOC117168303 [Belonocnema kinseyi]